MNTTAKTSFLKIIGLALAAALIALLANIILFYIGKSLGFFPESVLLPNQDQPLTLLPVILSSIMPSLVAGLIMALLNKYTKNPKKIFNTMAVALLIMSFANPFFIPGVPMMMAILLNVMHVTVAGSLLYTFNKYIV